MLTETKLSLAGTPLTVVGGGAIASPSLFPHESFFQQHTDLLHATGGIAAAIGTVLLVARYALRKHHETPFADTNPDITLIPFNAQSRGDEIARLRKNGGKPRHRKFL